MRENMAMRKEMKEISDNQSMEISNDNQRNDNKWWNKLHNVINVY